MLKKISAAFPVHIYSIPSYKGRKTSFVFTVRLTEEFSTLLCDDAGTDETKVIVNNSFLLSFSDSSLLVPQPCRHNMDVGVDVGSMSDLVNRFRIL